jgi:uncharacterized repeat protein (TIGR02543 family)
MPAPSGTVWGSIVGGYGRIGIYTSLTPLSTSPNTYYNLNVEVWFWSKYSVSDSSNTLYYDNLATASEATTSKGSVSLSTTVASGEGWSTSNQQKIATYSAGYNLETYTQTRYLRARLLNVDRVGGEMKVYATVTIPALTSYTITYNANGGTGAPSSQSKYYSHSIKLSTTKPTRTGYSFQGWATSASGSVAYAAGATYTGNANLTLYAVWAAVTYTITFDANGGTGAPSSQTKRQDIDIVLTRTVPTRTYYTFKGWGTSASSTTVAYAAGATYKANASVTLYAIWELTHYVPAVYSVSAARCDSSGTETEEGTYALVKFDWKMSASSGSCDIACLTADTEVAKTTGISLASSGSASQVVGGGALATDTTYTIEVTVKDANSKATTVTTTLAGMKFPIDILAGGGGVAFGKNAELENTAEFEFDAQFNGNAHGSVFGLARLPHLKMTVMTQAGEALIQGGKSFNDFTEIGCYAVYANSNMQYFKDYPGSMACGRLEVSSANGYGYRNSEWTYLRQRWIPYQTYYPIYERDITRDASNNWTYGEWIPTTLSKEASKKVYSKSAITIALGSSVTLGVVDTYTKLTLGTRVAATGDRLTLENGAIKVGAYIDYVKVSGLALIKCGSTAGNRHVRIQKVSNGTTSSVAWACVYGTAASNTPCSLPPVIVPVKNGDLLQMVFYTSDSADQNSSGSSVNGWQTYLTAEEL